MATLTVVTNNTTKICIKTADYAPGVGDFYVFYSAGTTTKKNSMGEGGLAEWYHGPAGSVATGSESTTPNATQAGAGWDSGHGDGGLCNYEQEQGVPCTDPGSAFDLADTGNACMQRVHLKGTAAASICEKYWTMWANGTHAVVLKNSVTFAANHGSPNTSVRTSYVSNTRIPSSSGTCWGFSGTHLGVMTALDSVFQALAGNTATYTASDEGGAGTMTGINALQSGTSMASGTKVCARLALSGYDGTVTVAQVTAWQNDFITHSGTNKTLTVATGTKTTSGTDLFGTGSTAWTDGYDPQRGAWIIAASSNHVNVGGAAATGWGIDGTTVTKRFRPCLILTGWTDANLPVVTLGGAAQVKGTDYEAYTDTGAGVLYLCLLKDISGTVGALDITAPVSYRTRRTLGPRTGSRTARPVV